MKQHSEIEKALAEAINAVTAARKAVYCVAQVYSDTDERAMELGDAQGVRFNAYHSGQCDDAAQVIEGVAQQLRRLRKMERRGHAR